MISIIGHAGKLAGLIDYQDGAIVSKEIIKRDKGTVTIFAFDGGQGLSEHTAPFDALVYIIDGKAEITVSGEASNIDAGEAMIMPANKPHAVKAIGRFKMLLIMIRS